MISTIIDSNDLTLLELKNFILKNPAKTIQEKGFKKLFPIQHSIISKIEFPPEFSWSQKLYHYVNNDTNIELGKCLHCGKRCKYIGFFRGYREFCSNSCVNKSEQRKIKSKETCLLKYGVENYSSTKECREKVKTTNLNLYGVENCFQSKELKEKSKLTCKSKYGADYFSQSQNFKDDYYQKILPKYEETCLSKYGVNNFSKSEISKQHKKDISDRVIKRMCSTKRKNHSFGSSKCENEFAQYLTDNNFKFNRQYKSDKYPFECDFYIIDFDLYIEIQGLWTHGFHPFNINDPNDIKTLSMWKSKNSPYYLDAIKTWTIRDVNKRKIAKENKLNYLEIFSCKIDVIIKQFTDYLK